MSQLHILTAHAKGEFVEAIWDMVDRTCSNAERQQSDLKAKSLTVDNVMGLGEKLIESTNWLMTTTKNAPQL